jgi:hypothetical protein
MGLEMREAAVTSQKPRVSSLYGVRVHIPGAELQATDAVVFGSLILVGALIILFHARIRKPWAMLGHTGLWAAVYIAALYLHAWLKSRILKFVVRTGSVQILFYELFLTCQSLQLIWASGWRDETLLAWERAVFGVQPTVWLQRFVTPPLTEWLMFSYVIYVVIYPALGAWIYFKRGDLALEDYLTTLALVNIVCFVGFMVFPVAGPLYHMAGAYTVPLNGGFFTAWGEYIRGHIHEAGSNLPSPHAAIATVMWAMAYRHVRPAFYALAPLILSLYVATFFLRYHYVSDTLFGILTAVLVIVLVPPLLKLWNAAARPREKT